MIATINRRGYFNAAHKLYNKNWSTTKNNMIFGKCANKNYHGHNYEFIIGITGNIDLDTGFVINSNTLKQIIFNEIEIYFDHKNLNLDIEEFSSVNPTMENIAIVIWNKIRKKISSNFMIKVSLYETKMNFVEYRGL